MSAAWGAIVVTGGGGHAKVVIGLLRKLHLDVAGYTDRRSTGPILGARHLGSDQILPELMRSGAARRVAMGVGKVDASPIRRLLGDDIRALGFDLPVIRSPHAVVNEDVVLGEGTVICDGAVVNVGTTIGTLCIVNSNSTVEHDCRLGHNVHLAPGATLSGGVLVGDDCMIGAGSTVVHQVTICAGSLIGAGSTVIRDITRPGVYAGNPVRRIR